MKRPLRERVFEQLVIDPETNCLLWTGSVDRHGYGRSGGNSIHRRMYEWFVGPIPEGLQLDHLCRVRNCANPAHLEPVTCQENLRRSDETHAARNRAKTHCAAGHPYDAANTYSRTRPGGGRDCRACQRQWRRNFTKRHSTSTP